MPSVAGAFAILIELIITFLVLAFIGASFAIGALLGMGIVHEGGKLLGM